MPWKILAALVASAIMLSVTIDLADARGRGGGGGGRGMGGGGRGFAHFAGPRHVSAGTRQFYASHYRHHGRHGRVVGIYPVYYYADGCEWLRRRALYSGSSYWWARYDACLYRYVYY